MAVRAGGERGRVIVCDVFQGGDVHTWVDPLCDDINNGEPGLNILFNLLRSKPRTLSAK